jgi:hypothetical protein
LKRHDTLVKTLRKDLKGVEDARRSTRTVTFAVAATHLVREKEGLGLLGEPVDAGELVDLAREAHAAAPSEGTRMALINVLLTRASRALAKQEPEFAKLAEQGKRSMGPNYLVPWVLGKPGSVRDRCLANDDVQQAIGLLRESNTALPDEPSAWAWAFLRATHPDEAAQLAEQVKKYELGTLDREIRLRLSPADTGAAFTTYWSLQLAGKEGEGLEVLKRCAALGVPLPVEQK